MCTITVEMRTRSTVNERGISTKKPLISDPDDMIPSSDTSVKEQKSTPTTPDGSDNQQSTEPDNTSKKHISDACTTKKFTQSNLSTQVPSTSDTDTTDEQHDRYVPSKSNNGDCSNVRDIQTDLELGHTVSLVHVTQDITDTHTAINYSKPCNKLDTTVTHVGDVNTQSLHVSMQAAPQHSQSHTVQLTVPKISSSHQLSTSRKEIDANISNTTSTQVTELTCVFTQTDMLQLRTQFMEVVEELRIRRASDKENEERLSQLMKQNQELQYQYEESIVERQSIKDATTSSMHSVRQENQNKLHDLTQIQHKLELSMEAYVQEIKSLKDEIRCLQLSKYSSEKQLVEQERRLRLRDNVRDTSMTQLTSLESRCNGLVGRVTGMAQDQQRLEANVKASCKLNKQLTYTVEHHRCEVTTYQTEINKLKHDLIQAHMKIESQPCELQQNLIGKDEANRKLQLQLNMSSERNRILEASVKETRDQLQQSEEQLSSSNELISRHVSQMIHRTQESCQLQMTLDELQTTHSLLQESYNTTVRELEVDRSTHKVIIQSWTDKEQSLESQLNTLKADHEDLIKAHNNLEELNTKWAERNTDLSQHINKLKDELNKPRRDQMIQTEQLTSSVCNQTESGLFSSSIRIQTEDIVTVDTAMQTIEYGPRLDLVPRLARQDAVLDPRLDDKPTEHSELQTLATRSVATVQRPVCNKENRPPPSPEVIPDSQPPPKKLCITSTSEEIIGSMEVTHGVGSCNNSNIDRLLKCETVARPADLSPLNDLSLSQPTYTTFTHDSLDMPDHQSNSEPTPHDDRVELTRYGMFTSTLKSIANMLTPGSSNRQTKHIGESKKRSLDSLTSSIPISTTMVSNQLDGTTEPHNSACNQLMLDAPYPESDCMATPYPDSMTTPCPDSINTAIPSSIASTTPRTCTSPGKRYSFQFSSVPSPSVLKTVTSIQDENAGSTTAYSVEHDGQDIAMDISSSPKKCDTNIPPSILLAPCEGSRNSKRVSFSKKLEHHDDSPQPSQDVIKKDDMLFSEDEADPFEIGSQVSKIERSLGRDRLRSHRSSMQ